jgi:multidrug resistance protein
MSDVYGRKSMFVTSTLVNIVASILCGLSKNIAMLTVFRSLQACGASSGQSLGAGVVADIIQVSERGKAYGFFSMGPLVGPVVGPTIGGFLCQYLGWQSSFYFLAILNTMLIILMISFMPETLRKKKIDPKECKKSSQALMPLLSMFFDPNVMLITLCNTVIYACLYFLVNFFPLCIVYSIREPILLFF